MSAEADRISYLQALGIDVWRERGSTGPLPGEEPPADNCDVPLMNWEQLQHRVANCTDCGLHKSRTQTVFGVGDPDADWMIIGEAPGQQEDQRGEPFVGRAGKLLDQMLLAVGLTRQKVFIANVLKCRPPNNRDPAKNEAAACRAHLERQIELIQPHLVLAVGRIAAQMLLESDAPLGRLRGHLHYLKDETLPLVVTYHPAYLLRSPSQKGKAWQDLCLARRVATEKSA